MNRAGARDQQSAVSRIERTVDYFVLLRITRVF
jgi:hypothetical protein